MASPINLDAVGIFWTTLAVVWTLAILAGASFLLYHYHRCPPLRIRGIPLSVCAVALLHGYWASVQLGYVVRDAMPGDAEYWIMGTWLPLGIALFHASNSRFLHVARAQRRFLTAEEEEAEQQKREEAERGGASPRGLISRVRRMEHTSRVFTLVGAGMVFQILVTIVVYVMSRKWHRSWGIPGTEAKGDTAEERADDIAKGWEWAHSVFWQFFWAWIVAPIILWQSRGIHDTQGWRVQTIGCCLAGLPATPMWLIALYTPGMEPVNEYFIPPQWIATSIMVLEVFTIFLPCWQVLRHQTLQQETLASIAQWEAKNQLPGDRTRSIVSGTTAVDSAITATWRLSANESILTMGALEHVLERNPAPLLAFSALRDFSGENIAFLTSVAAWRAAFSLVPVVSHREKSMVFEDGVAVPRPVTATTTTRDDDASREMRREQFNRALKIYVDFVSSRRAVFQVNLPSRTLKALETIFETPAQDLFGVGREPDPVTPFAAASDELWQATNANESTPVASEDGCSEKSMMDVQATQTNTLQRSPSSTVGDGARIRYSGAIPAEFDEFVFDAAEASVKYLVLTNTWPKFVKERRSSVDSGAVV